LPEIDEVPRKSKEEKGQMIGRVSKEMGQYNQLFSANKTMNKVGKLEYSSC